jgi:hypothetical protein
MKRRNPFERAGAFAHPIQLTGTDQAALKAIAEYGPISSEQVRQLVWPKDSQKTHAESRLRRLFDSGYIDRLAFDDGPGPARALYVLGPLGRRTDGELLGISQKAIPRPAKLRAYKPLFLNHHLATVQVVVNLRLAAERLAGSLVHYTSDRDLRRGRAVGTEPLPLVPDALVILSIANQTQSFFIELDRVTKSLVSWRRRFREYWGFAKSKAYETTYQSPAILIVFDAPRPLAIRRTVALAQLIKAEAGERDPTLFWLTTLTDAVPSSILTEPVWQLGSREGRYSLLPPVQTKSRPPNESPGRRPT